jgi:hypothetical protein
VFAARDLAARDAVSAGLAHLHFLTVQRLRESNRKLILPDAARSGHQQRLSDAFFGHRASQQFLYSIVPDEC